MSPEVSMRASEPSGWIAQMAPPRKKAISSEPGWMVIPQLASAARSKLPRISRAASLLQLLFMSAIVAGWGNLCKRQYGRIGLCREAVLDQHEKRSAQLYDGRH